MSSQNHPKTAKCAMLRWARLPLQNRDGTVASHRSRPNMCGTVAGVFRRCKQASRHRTKTVRWVATGARLLYKTMCTRIRTASCHTSEFRQMATSTRTSPNDVALGPRVTSMRRSTPEDRRSAGFWGSGLRVPSHPWHAPYMQVSRPYIAAVIRGGTLAVLMASLVERWRPGHPSAKPVGTSGDQSRSGSLQTWKV